MNKQRQENKNRLFILRSFSVFLIFSVLFHIFFFGGLSFISPPPIISNNNEVEISVIDSKDLNKKPFANLAKQIVTQDKQINDEIDEKAKYLSQFNQKVERETRAQDSGRFNNQPTAGNQAQKKSDQIEAEEVKKKDNKIKIDAPLGIDGTASLDSFKPSFKPRQFTKESDETRGAPGLRSQSDDYLKETQTGLQTLLSTREFVYYSYYNRIKEKVQQHWEPNLREKVKKLYIQGRKLASSQDRITQVLIILSPEGKLIQVQIATASGVTDLDQAAIEAFRAAAPFPNPPKGMVEADGTIKISWAFVLEA